MRLNKNLESLNIYRNYKNSLVENASSLNRISTGVKINSAKDNPNKIGMSEGLRLQIRSLQMAEKNIQDGVSMIQTFDGALGSVSESLSRIKELTVKAGGANSDDDLAIIQNEIDQLKADVDYTANNTEFNGIKLLNSDSVSDNNKPRFLNHTIGSTKDEDVKIPIFDIRTNMLKDDQGNYLSDLDVTDKSKMDSNLSSVDGAIRTISTIRGKYGAVQNRLEDASLNLSSSSLNLEKTESRIRDTDVALEMSEYAKSSLLIETSIGLMQQSNNFPKDILRILENIK